MIFFCVLTHLFIAIKLFYTRCTNSVSNIPNFKYHLRLFLYKRTFTSATSNIKQNKNKTTVPLFLIEEIICEYFFRCAYINTCVYINYSTFY